MYTKNGRAWKENDMIDDIDNDMAERQYKDDNCSLDFSLVS
jgi:hypothetical protein